MKSMLIGVLLGLALATAGGWLLRDEPAPAPVVSVAKPATKHLALSAEEAAQLTEVMERVQRDYVDAVSEPELLTGALRGVVSGLDPYSSYLDADEYADLRVSTSGTYAGIGIEVSTADHALRVVRPFRDSPAAEAGLLSGDLIAAIDGEAVGTDLDAAMARMRGPRGSTVKLAVLRAGQALPLEFTVERAQVDVHSVTVVPLGSGFGYVRIAGFSDTTVTDFTTGIDRLRREQGGKIRGLVLDLRNNPGGVLESAVDIADQVLGSGVIVSADGRTPTARFRMEASPGDSLEAVPLVVLVNGASASAAEILAGALQDHRRATLLGRRTFGKGSVQTVMPLTAGRAMKLTTSRYFTPSGRSIQGRGIDPDIEFAAIDGTALDLDDRETRRLLSSRDPAIHAALEVLNGRKPRLPSGMTASAGTTWK
jgi:carboxyl-terminal processing protease